MFVGLDFGTTNSALATIRRDSPAKVTQFELFGKAVDVFRSVLYFSFSERDELGQPRASAGPKAMEDYLEEDGMGRLILSPKTSLASAVFETTQILHKRYTLEELVAIILRFLREEGEKQFGVLGSRVVAGRPVRFAGEKTAEDEQRALERLKRAFAIVGFDEVVFEFEPVAAAANYEASLDHEELVLVADFGGGTTDFCVIQVGPESRHKRGDEKILGIDGVAIAGDIFDGRIVRRFVAPHFGLKSTFRSEFGERLPMPAWPYRKLSQWHLISMLQDNKTLGMLHDIRRRSKSPKKIASFIECIEGNLGFHLYRSIEHTKLQLSNEQTSQFKFRELMNPISGEIQRHVFEDWIAKELAEIAGCCDALIQRVGLVPAQIDRVFMTGGTSFVPSVRQIFVDRFGEDKMGKGSELTSVVSGLAHRAMQEFG